MIMMNKDVTYIELLHKCKDEVIQRWKDEGTSNPFIHIGHVVRHFKLNYSKAFFEANDLPDYLPETSTVFKLLLCWTNSFVSAMRVVRFEWAKFHDNIEISSTDFHKLLFE